MLHKTYTTHTRTKHTSIKHTHLLILSCIFLVLDTRRRAIAECDRQHLRIYHTCYTTHIQSIFEKYNIDNPYWKSGQHILKYRNHTLADQGLLLDMRRRAIAQFDRQHLRIDHTCYTTHIQSILENSIRGDVWDCCGPSYSLDTF